MPVLLFRLRNVPDDEADEIRRLLTEHNVDYYETPAGNWGISMPALWLDDEDALDRAKALIDAYQDERAARKRQEYEELKRQGRHRTLLDAFREQPLLFLFYCAVAGLVLYVSTKPFLNLALGVPWGSSD